jgi:zinc/manganese transport system substrate-binding protein
LDPGNGRLIAAAVRDKLTELSPADAGSFAQRSDDFDRRLPAEEQRWDSVMAPYEGTELVTYYRSWPNFMARFGLEVVGYVEPKPGIPPSLRHTLQLIEEMKRDGVALIVVEPSFNLKTPEAIVNQVTGGRVLVLAPSVGGVKEMTNYIELFDYDVDLLAGALRQVTGK